ncbi:sigma-70 family RNA polymerase sigma factor [Pelagibius sp.]|uniref:sigma-70 family RNA polymerase sigma factor n=1 Tax=Pelagibius sp. TaxID=1931238 RepID=UPI00260D7E46|nr:sigma-70 family RNA polymerase sigma factor [Pelagibius sp.]
MTEARALTADSWADFESRLRSYVRRRVDPASVDDVIGGILLRLVQHQDDLMAARNPVAWAYRVAANAVTDHHRRRASERQALTQQAQVQAQEEGAARPQTDDDEPSAAEDLARCLIPLIKNLPAPYAEALLLTEIEGLTQAAAAERLGLSLSGMKSRIQRGRRKLKAALLGCCAVRTDRHGAVIDYSFRPGGKALRC